MYSQLTPIENNSNQYNQSIELNQSLNIGPSPNQIKLRPPMEVPQTTTVQMYSQLTPIENNSNQLIDRADLSPRIELDTMDRYRQVGTDRQAQ